MLKFIKFIKNLFIFNITLFCVKLKATLDQISRDLYESTERQRNTDQNLQKVCSNIYHVSLVSLNFMYM